MSPRDELLVEEDEMVLLPTTCSTILYNQDDAHNVHSNETSFLLPTTINDDDNGGGGGGGGDDDSNKASNTSSSFSSSSLVSLIYHEVMEQSKTFLPTLQSLILGKFPWFITLRILGEMDDNNASNDNASDGSSGQGVELAAAALATTLCNVTGMSLCIGFSFALSTLAGQAKGEMLSRPKKQNNNNDTAPIQDIGLNTPIIFLLRGLIVQILLVLPVGIWWIYGIENFLIALGQTPILAIASSNYLQILAPSLWIYSIQWTVTAWTQSIGLASIPAQASLLGLVCHIPFNYIFVYLLGFGYLGCAYATICFQAIQLCYISIYLFISQQGKQKVLIATGGQHIGHTTISNCFKREFYIASTSLTGYQEYLNLAIPGIIVISEWWASETAIFLSGTIQPYPQTTLAAMTIYQSINSFCFMIPAGFATAGCARVSNLLGGGQYKQAKLAGQINVTCCGVASTCIGLLLFILPHTLLPSLFVSSKDNQAIINQTASTIPYLSIYVLADGIQTGCNGIIKGCGRQKIVVPIVVFAYWIVGVPLAYYLGIYRNNGNDLVCKNYNPSDTGDTNNDNDNDNDGTMILCGDVGLVAGMTAGTWVHMLLLLFVVIGTTNWKNEANKAKQRVTKQQ